MSLHTILFVSVLFYLFYKYMCRNFHYWKSRNVSYIEPVPFVGNFLDVMLLKKNIGDYFGEIYSKSSEPILGMFAFDKPQLMIRDPELIKLILIRDSHNFDDRSIARGKDAVFSEILFVSKSPHWKMIRSKLTPAFTSGKLKTMLPLIDEVTENLKKYIDRKVLPLPSVDMKEMAVKYTTDIIGLVSFGINAHSFDQDNAEMIRLGRKCFQYNVVQAIQQACYVFKPAIANLLHMQFIPSEATAFFKRVFWNTKKSREESPGTRRNDILDILIQMENDETCKKNNINENKILAQAVQFFLAGLESTSSSIAFTLYELCLHSDIQDKLRQEIKDCLKNGGFTYENVMGMKYLDMCISEILRKYPTIPFLERRCKEDYRLEKCDLVIEKNMSVYIPVIGLHYNPTYFPDPQKFDPERFNEENGRNITPYSYLPFGDGPRSCIGARLGLLAVKLGIVHILSDYEVVKSDQTPEVLEFEAKSFVLASKVGLPMRLKKLIS